MSRTWTFNDDEAPPDARCYDCGTLYPFPVEMCVSEDEWEMINPSQHKGGGLLCHNCMIDRFREMGREFITVTTFIITPEDEIGIPDFGDELDKAEPVKVSQPLKHWLDNEIKTCLYNFRYAEMDKDQLLRLQARVQTLLAVKQKIDDIQAS